MESCLPPPAFWRRRIVQSSTIRRSCPSRPPDPCAATPSNSQKMPTIAYLANQFPSPVEPYVYEEIAELRRRGLQVIACSARCPDRVTQETPLQLLAAETLYLEPIGLAILLRASW